MAVWTTLQSYAQPLVAIINRSGLPVLLQRMGDELLRCMPSAWRNAFSKATPAYALKLHADHIEWFDQEGLLLRKTTDLPLHDEISTQRLVEGVEQSGKDLHLLIDTKQVLRKVLTMPQSAESRLHEMMAFEIDRQTPFSLDQVSYAVRVLERWPERAQISVELLVLPVERLQSLKQTLGPLAARLAGIDVLQNSSAAIGVNLLPAADRYSNSSSSNQRVWLFLAIGIFALLLAMFAMRYERQKEVTEWQAKVAAAEEKVREARRLRNQVSSIVDEEGFMREQRSRYPSLLSLIDDLTRRIPNDTSFDRFSVNDQRLTLVGVSRKATDLVGQLQDSPYIQNPAIAGAVQADPRTGRDRFTMTAAVVSKKNGASAP
jgi:general secretion pathway protein L